MITAVFVSEHQGVGFSSLGLRIGFGFFDERCFNKCSPNIHLGDKTSPGFFVTTHSGS